MVEQVQQQMVQQVQQQDECVHTAEQLMEVFITQEATEIAMEEIGVLHTTHLFKIFLK